MLLNASVYAKNQAPKTTTLARTIFFILPFLGLYRAKREVYRGIAGEEGRGGWHFKYSPKLDPMPNLRPISQMVWPEHSAFIFQYYSDFRVKVETPPSPNWGGVKTFLGWN